MDELLRLAHRVEMVGIGGAWTSSSSALAKALDVPTQKGRSRIEPAFLLQLHEALSVRMRELLGERYQLEQTRHAVRWTPRHEPVSGVVLGLHGPMDTGLRFSGVFGELLLHHPLELICPSAGKEGWTDRHGEQVMELVREYARDKLPLWVVGLSSGANLALRLRPALKGKAEGVVAIASSPWKVNPAAADVPTLYIHGTADRLFDMKDLTRYLQRAGVAEGQLREVDGWGHGFPYRLLLRQGWPWMEKQAKVRAARRTG